jgi:MFS transporter, PPP family, 3-phenylpropionic acid transporter
MREVGLASAIYFGYFTALGAFVTFNALFYQGVGLSSPQIGLLTALPVFISVMTSLLWTGFADSYRLHRVILAAALLLVPVPVLIMAGVREFETLIVLTAVYAFFITPILPLIDSAALDVAARHGRTYGDLRVWGTVGFALVTWLAGALIEQQGIQWMFYVVAATMWITLLLTLFQRMGWKAMGQPLRQGLRQLLLRRDFAIFMVSVFLVQMTLSSMSAFFGIYLKSIGAGEATIGLASTLAGISEIPALFFSRVILRRFGPATVLKIAFAVYALRWLLLSFATEPIFAVATNVLHGASFGAFLVGGVAYLNERTPPGMEATAMSIFGTIGSYGLPTIVGSLLGGALFDTLDHATFFRLLSVIAACGLGLFMFNRGGAEVRDE